MKNKSAIISIGLLVGVNSSFLWEFLPERWDFLLSLLFVFIWILLIFVFILKFGALFIDQFKNLNNTISVIIIGLVLIFCYLFPLGLIRSSVFDPDFYLKASREGTMCSTSIILGVDNTFIKRSYCFGTETKSGNYRISNDTVYFIFNDKPEYVSKKTIGILDFNENKIKGNYGYLEYYIIATDDKPMNMKITELKE